MSDTYDSYYNVEVGFKNRRVQFKLHVDIEVFVLG